MINVRLIAGLLTLATRKDYLDFKHFAWDPAIFGAVLIIAAIVIMHWLAHGGREAGGDFTAQNLLKPENHGINLAAISAAYLAGAIHANLQQHRLTDPSMAANQQGKSCKPILIPH